MKERRLAEMSSGGSERGRGEREQAVRRGGEGGEAKSWMSFEGDSREKAAKHPNRPMKNRRLESLPLPGVTAEREGERKRKRRTEGEGQVDIAD